MMTDKKGRYHIEQFDVQEQHELLKVFPQISGNRTFVGYRIIDTEGGIAGFFAYEPFMLDGELVMRLHWMTLRDRRRPSDIKGMIECFHQDLIPMAKGLGFSRITADANYNDPQVAKMMRMVGMNVNLTILGYLEL
jgi:hypothetical protein